MTYAASSNGSRQVNVSPTAPIMGSGKEELAVDCLPVEREKKSMPSSLGHRRGTGHALVVTAVPARKRSHRWLTHGNGYSVDPLWSRLRARIRQGRRTLSLLCGKDL